MPAPLISSVIFEISGKVTSEIPIYSVASSYTANPITVSSIFGILFYLLRKNVFEITYVIL